jgi:hypothetical protein
MANVGGRILRVPLFVGMKALNPSQYGILLLKWQMKQISFILSDFILNLITVLKGNKSRYSSAV